MTNHPDEAKSLGLFPDKKAFKGPAFKGPRGNFHGPKREGLRGLKGGPNFDKSRDRANLNSNDSNKEKTIVN